jgi:indoleacetate---CoA ligase
MDLAHWVERSAAFTPDKLAIRFVGNDMDYTAFAGRIRRTGRRLAALGVGRGDLVAYLGRNHPEMLALLFACARCGAIVVPLNWRHAAPEHARVLADCSPRAILVDTTFTERAQALRDDHPGMIWTTLGDVPAGWTAWNDLGLTPEIEPAPLSTGSLEDPVLVCYTSGSTGVPKGVVHTQNTLLWNALNSVHMHDLTSADRVLTTLPLFHVGGLNILTLPAFHAGASVTLHEQFEPLATIEAIERERITLTVLVPAQLTAMMDHPRWRQADLSSLRMITTGSTIISESFIRRVNERGLRLVQVYGSTETCPIATYVRAEDADRKAGAAGLPALHCEVRVVDAEGNDVAAGQDGEIVVRGPNVSQGYWRAPAATAAAYRGGWYYSNDIGHFDDEGYLHVVSRKTDMIISGGENIYPAELENILLECSAILEACIVGRPDERWGEALVAIVVLQPGARMSEADVLALFDDRIARYKRPREIRFADALPRTALGKVMRTEVLKAISATVEA